MIDRVTVPEASRLLHISEGAVRQRIHRGTLRTDKDEEGRVYVYITPQVTQNIGETYASDNDVITELRSRIKFLEHELEDRKEENKRNQAILLSMTQRIPQLEASSEEREPSVTDSEGEPNAPVPPEAQQRSWWRRFF